ncbi:MAG: hypothetical protein RL095_967 [Verrucomicrobiota bacterium]|jgi:hypothetical protein
MTYRKYILPKDEVGCLTQAVAIQDGTVLLEKDDKSTFYLAHLQDDMVLPLSLHILEVADSREERPQIHPENKSKPAPAKQEADSDEIALAGMPLDLRMRFLIPQGMDRGVFEKVLKEEIGKAVERSLKRISDDEK